MPTTPTMLPTMRYDPNRDAVWVCPEDGAAFLVTRNAIEEFLRSHEPLTPHELLDTCETHKAVFTLIAAFKFARGDVDQNGRAVVMTPDVYTIG